MFLPSAHESLTTPSILDSSQGFPVLKLRGGEVRLELQSWSLALQLRTSLFQAPERQVRGPTIAPSPVLSNHVIALLQYFP